MTSLISKFLNRDIKPITKQNEYKPKIKIQSTVDEGKGLTFNEKTEHIFINELKYKICSLKNFVQRVK